MNVVKRHSGRELEDLLNDLLNDIESDRVERKRAFKNEAEKARQEGSEMAVVTVLPSDMPPVRYKGQIWIRTGPGRAVANAQEERILNEKRRFKDMPFDLHPVISAK
ncbi:MAG: hypothetical protein LBP69_09710 [Treponema sp.]|jgi:ATP-dependent DNA helicase RecG|nr:hypothetical protein [Treponema sp.]